MSWLVNGLGNIASTVFGVMMKIIGFGINLVAAGIFKLVNSLLTNTIFKPFTLSGNIVGHFSIVGYALDRVWIYMAAISVGVALVMLVFSVFSRHILTGLGGKQSWAEIGEGLAVWMVVLVAGWGMLGLLLNISNVATLALVTDIQKLMPLLQHKGPTAVSTTVTAAAVITDLLEPLVIIFMAILLVWAVGVWLMRQVDLVLYAGILPLMAAIGIGGNKNPFKWAWTETMGAVFNQLAMAFIMWIGYLFLSEANKAYGSHIWAQFVEMFLAITTFTMMARAPKILANITGHQSAGAGHVLAGMALGYMGGRGLEAVAKSTPLGQAAGQMMEGRAARSKAKVAEWGGHATVGEKLGQTGVGQRVKNWASTTASAAQDAWAGSAAGAAVKSASEKYPVIPNTAAIIGKGARAAGRVATTPASMAYQPLATLGRAAAAGRANSAPEGPMGTMDQSASATMFMAEHGVHAAALRYAPGETGQVTDQSLKDLGNLTNANIYPPDPAKGSGYQIQFAEGAWQSTLYNKTLNSPLQQVPTTVQKPKVERVYT